MPADTLRNNNVDANRMQPVTAPLSALPASSTVISLDLTNVSCLFVHLVLCLQDDALLRIFDFMGPEEVEAAEFVNRRLRQFGNSIKQN